MGIIIFITVVVFAISMYDFLSSRNWQQVTSDLRNDVVFDQRNKSYGAYQIRKDYDRNLILIMFGLLVSVGIISGAVHFLTNKSILPKEIEIPITDPFTINPTDVIIDMKLDPKVDPKPEGNSGPSLKNLPVVVTDEEKPNEKLPTQDELDGSKSGTSTANPTGGSGFGNGSEGTGTGDGSEGIGSVDVVHDFTQFEAEFPGGITALNKFLSSKIRYPESAIGNGKQGKVYVRFVIGKDGSIENATVVRGVLGAPELDAEALRVVKLMPKWKPAKHNGKVVKSYFNLPVDFRLE